MKHRFADKALAKLIAAGTYYSRQIPGLGDDFVDEVGRDIEVILRNPETWRIVQDDLRRYLIRRFPFGIYYTIEGQTIMIWSVRHLHRGKEPTSADEV